MQATPAKTVVVIGASGAIGQAITKLCAEDLDTQVFAFSRSKRRFEQQNLISGYIDFDDEQTLENTASLVREKGEPNMVFITTGILHEGTLQPEKSISQLSQDHMTHVMTANTIGPALALKHFLPIMPRKSPYLIAALSARVGSISDNGLGGWYSYRASKAALNMIIKTTSIEAQRKNKQSTIIGLHPGTVDSALSEPFQKNVAEDKLFTPEFSAEKLVSVAHQLTPADTGKCFAWDGQLIEP